MPPLVQVLRRFPDPRLTGLGSGLFCVAAMLGVGLADRLLLDGSPGVYGVLFVLVSAVTAKWVRKADLVAAPVVVPLAFAVGALAIAKGSGGFGGQVMGLVTALSLNAGWLYCGTLVAGVIVTVRKVRLMARRAAARRAGDQQAPAPRRGGDGARGPRGAGGARPHRGAASSRTPGPRRRPA
ncbi:DUF6542 domain-containing protein [Streptomyces beihaiensis]|uniref:DUF6542 domain-containing protein n=1 Tax=Streptomyces beihaiensis TaxID=2984495 RepID=A0ABT3TZ42_9ACTN|nr:DUF6542 domain-containing protein [Streptomyces beihaiensis]MCX3062055.1 hypothetical protein [Streptomyces beihaiensis]